MLRVLSFAAFVLCCACALCLSACEEKKKEPPPQFRPSMATTPVPSRPIEPLPPTVRARKPVTMDDYKDATAPVVEIKPGMHVCRECEMQEKKRRARIEKRRAEALKRAQNAPPRKTRSSRPEGPMHPTK